MTSSGFGSSSAPAQSSEGSTVKGKMSPKKRHHFEIPQPSRFSSTAAREISHFKCQQAQRSPGGGGGL